jgi:GTP:adenosylcobinamide-phosphate guanylyltransferase
VGTIVLAGGKNSPELRDAAKQEFRALIDFQGRPLVEKALAAVRAAATVARVVLIGPPELEKAVEKDLYDILVPEGKSMVDNVFLGLEALGTGNREQGTGKGERATNKRRKALIISGDLPLVKAEAVEDFVEQALRSGADIAFAIVRRENYEARFPGGQRTYARLRDGAFTGANAMLVGRDFLVGHRQLIESAYAARKSPLRLVAILGPGFLLRFLLRRLAVEDVVRRAERILGGKGAAIESRHAELALDIDKPTDLEAAKRYADAHRA